MLLIFTLRLHEEPLISVLNTGTFQFRSFLASAALLSYAPLPARLPQRAHYQGPLRSPRTSSALPTGPPLLWLLSGCAVCGARAAASGGSEGRPVLPGQIVARCVAAVPGRPGEPAKQLSIITSH